MDIRSLLDSDQSNSAPKAPAQSPNVRKEEQPERQWPSQIPRSPYESQPPYDHPHREGWPPQPPPLRPPPPSEFRSPSVSSYTPSQSPYQKTPSSGFSTGQYPFPQHPSPARGPHTHQSIQHDGHVAPAGNGYPMQGYSASLPQTPTSTTPGSTQGYSQHQRPLSSHSASTPTSTNLVPNVLRESPQAAQAQIRGPPYSNASHHYMSQPGTPLGPPTTFGRQPSNLRRGSPGELGHKRANSGGQHINQQLLATLPTADVRSFTAHSPPEYAPKRSPSHSQLSGQLISHERERSLSVSPKTRLPNQPKLKSPEMMLDRAQIPDRQATLSKRKLGDSPSDELMALEQRPAKRSMSLAVNGILNASDETAPSWAAPSHEAKSNKPASYVTHNESNESSSQSTFASDPVLAPPQSQRDSQSLQASGSETLTPSTQPSQNHKASSPPGPRNQMPAPSTSPSQIPTSQQSNYIEKSKTPTMKDGATLRMEKKRWRSGEVPIYAQSFRKVGLSELHKRNGAVKPSTLMKRGSQPPATDDANGTLPYGNEVSTSQAQAEMPNGGLLGPWEPSITNVVPAEELTREISNYLFAEVVQRNGCGFAPAGGMQSSGAIVEIEAKIGNIIDRNTNDRIRIPVMTECILDRNDPSLRTAFRSSMTEDQHRALNRFLNNALLDSQPSRPGAPPPPPHPTPSKSRVPMSYVHTHEIDTFYDLTPTGLNTLPPSVQAVINPRNRPKVRITTDQKTGRELARIIKVRVSDIEVYSPMTIFDWRVSVNLEVSWEGDKRDLMELVERREGKRPDRNKDRVSYRHSHYQIDLTQVTPAEATSKTEKEHELEIEVSSAAVREQGQLVLASQPNQYEDLIRGFVDNVRILARHCKREQF
ncbi:MAG: hypothetical protein LQ342_005751 [Letrouitia transgressa]|nr:MAG: hypothetical protein LQ342_005751 [Letrouitia transgressa]